MPSSAWDEGRRPTTAETPALAQWYVSGCSSVCLTPGEHRSVVTAIVTVRNSADRENVMAHVLRAAAPMRATAARVLRTRSLSTAQPGAPVPLTVMRGDGVGPEITEATLAVLSAAKASLAPEFVTVGEQLYQRGITSGIDETGWASIEKTRLMLKAPITTPLGKVRSCPSTPRCAPRCATARPHVLTLRLLSRRVSSRST